MLDKPKVTAEEMAEQNDLSVEINQAYINIVGEEYADAEECAEAYAGEYDSDEDFAQQLAEDTGAIKKDLSWPYSCIDWEHAARELMYDYSEDEGHYFRNL